MKKRIWLLFSLLGVFAISLVTFSAVYGAFVVFNQRHVVTFNFEKSGDLASWIQAFTSFVAIVGSYFIGAKQAREAQDAALDLYHLDRRRLEEGCRAIIYQMAGEIGALKEACETFAPSGFRSAWQSYLKSAIESALHSFDNMPIHEIGNYEAIQHAYEIRAHAAHIARRVDRIVVQDLTPSPEISRGTKEERKCFEDSIDAVDSEVKTKLRSTIKDGQERAESLYALFQAAFAR